LVQKLGDEIKKEMGVWEKLNSERGTK
jgi:hypothetical protein